MCGTANLSVSLPPLAMCSSTPMNPLQAMSHEGRAMAATAATAAAWERVQLQTLAMELGDEVKEGGAERGRGRGAKAQGQGGCEVWVGWQ